MCAAKKENHRKMQTQIYAAQWTTIKFKKYPANNNKNTSRHNNEKKSASESDEIGGREENKNANDRPKNDNNVGRAGNCEGKN